jgi:hypothetical protein
MYTLPFYKEIESEAGIGPNRATNLRRVAFMKAASYLSELMSGDSTILPCDVPDELTCTPNFETYNFGTVFLDDLCKIINEGIKAHKKTVEEQVGAFEFEVTAALPKLEKDME